VNDYLVTATERVKLRHSCPFARFHDGVRRGYRYPAADGVLARGLMPTSCAAAEVVGIQFACRCETTISSSSVGGRRVDHCPAEREHRNGFQTYVLVVADVDT
jgi:hypothetical protein